MSDVILERQEGVATIYLNRPEKYNALGIETLKQLLASIEEVEKSDDRILILTGKGKAFCAGGDIDMMNTIHDESMFGELMDVLSQIAMKIYMMPKIVISAVNGSAAGLGMSLALTADYVVAQEDAKFGMLFAGIGLIPDGGGHFWLKERLGTQRAKHFIWSLEQVQGKIAREMGFVDILVPGDAVEGALGLSKKLLASPYKAIVKSKLILHEAKQAELQSYLDKEKVAQFEMRQTRDHKEGIQAFIEKRRPQFVGE